MLDAKSTESVPCLGVRTGVTSLTIGPFSGGGDLPFGRVLEQMLRLNNVMLKRNGTLVQILRDQREQLYRMLYASASRLSTKPATA